MHEKTYMVALEGERAYRRYVSTITLLVWGIETFRASHGYAPPLLWPTLVFTLGVALGAHGIDE